MKALTLRIITIILLLGAVACRAAESEPPVPAGEPQATLSPATRPIAATATPEPTTEPAVRFEAAPCPQDLPNGIADGEEISCGYVNVPAQRAQFGVEEDAGHIRLAVAIIHSTSGKPAPDPLVMLAGGPGQSALVAYTPLLAAPGLEALWAERDIVLIEPRGTQYAPPLLSCPEVAAFKLETLSQQLDDTAEEAGLLAAWSACHDRFVTDGVNLGAYNSLEIAADTVSVLDALGYDQFNLYGGSYGSLLAQHLMRDYPGRVRSAILDSVSPLQHEPNLLYKAHSTDAALRGIFTACAADSACAATYPDLESVYFDLVEQLNEQPAMLQIVDPSSGDSYDLLLTGERLLVITRDILYITSVLPDFPAAVYAMIGGDFTLVELIQARSLFSLQLADGLYNSVICSELADFVPADMADPAGLYPQLAASVTDLVDEVMLQPCQVWGVPHLGEQVTTPVVGDIPTLLLSGEYDPTVPPAMAEVVAAGLTQAYAYTFPGFGHGVLGDSCATTMMAAFLDDPTQAPDTTCLDEKTGLVFSVPGRSAVVELQPYSDEERGFSGLVPTGWQELAPANLARGSSAMDPAYFVLEAQPDSAANLFVGLSAQLGLDPALEPDSRSELGSLTWDFYTFEVQGLPADLALAEDGERAYFVLLISPVEEHEALYEQLFLPAVAAMAPLA
jgi:pimeloyl-ACP methyl ester carboxylesterase